MNTLTADEKTKLWAGAVVAAVVLWVSLSVVTGRGLLASAGPEVSVPAIGAASVWQVVLSLLVSLGGFAITVGKSLLGTLLASFLPRSRTPAPANEEQTLEALAANRLNARDEAGYRLVFELHGRCTGKDDGPTPETPPAQN